MFINRDFMKYKVNQVVTISRNGTAVCRLGFLFNCSRKDKNVNCIVIFI